MRIVSHIDTSFGHDIVFGHNDSALLQLVLQSSDIMVMKDSGNTHGIVEHKLGYS